MDIAGQNPTLSILDVVVDTGSRELSLTSNLRFGEKASRIIDIVAIVRDIGYHIIGNKVIVQGTLHKQIFYLNQEDTTKCQSEHLPFATFIELNGLKTNYKIHLDAKVERIYRQLSEDSMQLYQKATVIITGVVLELGQHIVYRGCGSLFRIREIVGRNNCHVTEIHQTLFQIPVEQITSLDVQLQEVFSIASENRVKIQGFILRKTEFVANQSKQQIEETIPFTCSVDMPGVLPEMHVLLSHDKEVEKIQCGLPILNKAGDIMEQEIHLTFSLLVWHYRHVNLLQDSGPVFQLEKVISQNSADRVIECIAYLDEACQTILHIHYQLLDMECDVILDKLLAKGHIKYIITYLSSDGLKHEKRCSTPFILTIDAEGALITHVGDVMLRHITTQGILKENLQIVIRTHVQIVGSVYDKTITAIHVDHVQHV
jgi:hypothetical protein